MQEYPRPYRPGPQGQSSGSGVGASGAEKDPESYEAWSERSRLVITPVAAPSILGLFGFAGATFMVASNLAGWWGNAFTSPLILAPFVIFFGGLAQLLAAMWSYRARDGLATAMHGTWGSFWLAWGLLNLGVVGGFIPLTATTSEAFGFWFIVLALITLFGSIAALGQNLGLFLTLALLTAGSALLAAGLIGVAPGVITAAGWVLVASSAAAFYTAAAMMLEQSYGGRVILPVGRWSLRDNIPGRLRARPIGYASGMPGVRPGQ